MILWQRRRMQAGDVVTRRDVYDDLLAMAEVANGGIGTENVDPGTLGAGQVQSEALGRLEFADSGAVASVTVPYGVQRDSSWVPLATPNVEISTSECHLLIDGRLTWEETTGAGGVAKVYLGIVLDGEVVGAFGPTLIQHTNGSLYGVVSVPVAAGTHIVQLAARLIAPFSVSTKSIDVNNRAVMVHEVLR